VRLERTGPHPQAGPDPQARARAPKARWLCTAIEAA